MSNLYVVQQIAYFEFSLPQMPCGTARACAKKPQKIKNSTCVTHAIVIFALHVTCLLSEITKRCRLCR